MQLSDIFIGLGQENFNQLVRSISISRLKTYQMYERIKTRLRVQKLNTEALRKVAPRAWERVNEPDIDFATELGQSVLISHLEMIKDVLDFLKIPHEEGFFAKDLDPKDHLHEGWQQKVLEQFDGKYPRPLVLFYINHLAWEVQKAEEVWGMPAA